MIVASMGASWALGIALILGCVVGFIVLMILENEEVEKEWSSKKRHFVYSVRVAFTGALIYGVVMGSVLMFHSHG